MRGALTLIDLLLGGSIESTPIAAPPGSPIPGMVYRIAESGASGAFAGQEGRLAGFGEGGWRFVSPIEGMRLTDRSSGLEVAYRGGAWTSGSLRASEVLVGGQKVVGGRVAAIAAPAGGSVVDAEARSTIAQILNGLRAHGLIAT